MILTSLTEYEKKKIMKELMDKYNKETLSKEEVKKLRILLQEKQEEAFKMDGKILAMGIGFLVAGLIAYLALKD
jgi:predicted ribosome-associated RNA-binding protein Tma20